MINGKLIGIGISGIIYKCPDRTCLKVYYQNPHNAKYEFERMKRGREKGINVPYPYELSETIIEWEDLKSLNPWNHFVNKYFDNNVGNFRRLVENREAVPMIRREFIEGTSLDKFWVPRKVVRQGLLDLLAKVSRVGLVSYDWKASNLVLTPDKKIYLVDCEQLRSKEEIAKVDSITRFLSNHPPICKLENWLAHILDTPNME